MAVLVPDNRQLGLQGNLPGARVQAPPPMPTDMLGEGQKQSDTLNKLGQVITNEAINQQNMLNEAMVSDATTAALKGFTQSMSAQLERKGYQVYSQSQTDTSPARMSAIDEFNAQANEIVASAMPKFLNDVQRQKYQQWVDRTLPSMQETVSKHQSQQIYQQSQASQAARIQTTSDTVVTYADAGLIDNMQEPLREIKSLIPVMMEQQGASNEAIVQAVNSQLNKTIGTAINGLIADGRTVEAAEIYSKYGTNLTGETAVSVRQAVQAGVDLVYADTVVNNLIAKAPRLPNGAIDWTWVENEAMKTSSSIERQVRVQGATSTEADFDNMANALTGIIGYIETTGGANAQATYGGRDIGAWQMDPQHRIDATDEYNKKYGTNLSPDEIDWSNFNQDSVAWQAVSALMRKKLVDYKGDYEAVAIGWNGGDSWGDDYHDTPAGQREDWLNRHSAFKRYLHDDYKFYYYAKQYPEWGQSLSGGSEANITTNTVIGYSPKFQAILMQKIEFAKNQETSQRNNDRISFVTKTLDSGKKFATRQDAINYARASGFNGQDAIDVGNAIFQPTQIERADTAYKEGQQMKAEREKARAQAQLENQATEEVFAHLIAHPNASQNEIIAVANNRIPKEKLYHILNAAKSGKGTWASSYNLGVLNQAIDKAGMSGDALVKAHLYEELSKQDEEKVRTTGEHLSADEVRATSVTYLREKHISDSPFASNPRSGEYDRFTSGGFVYQPSIFGHGTYTNNDMEYSYQEGTQGALVSGSTGDEWE